MFWTGIRSSDIEGPRATAFEQALTQGRSAAYSIRQQPQRQHVHNPLRFNRGLREQMPARSHISDQLIPAINA
ncbi:hypothetical protein L195_g027280, partial [Trifolium pratense]